MHAHIGSVFTKLKIYFKKISFSESDHVMISSCQRDTFFLGGLYLQMLSLCVFLFKIRNLINNGVLNSRRLL